jgi:uncharacterized membrane protein YfcA
MLNTISLRHIGILMILLKSALILFFILQIIFFSTEGNPLSFNNDIFIFIAAGFAAQLIDGALGMAYGVSCNSLLLGFGIPPALASASIHTAEVFTTGVSGLSHLLLRNVNRRLLLKIAIPGVIGSAAGAFLISNIFDGGIIKPVISGYLLLMGVLILRKSLSKAEIVPQTKTGKVSFLGLAGGFFDAVGGGGWGPIVTTNLIHRGNTPKQTIGTVNTAEFFVSFVSTGIFIFFLGVQNWQIVLGLIIGGVIASPIGALLAGKIKPKILMTLVGITIITISAITIIKALM